MGPAGVLTRRHLLYRVYVQIGRHLPDIGIREVASPAGWSPFSTARCVCWKAATYAGRSRGDSRRSGWAPGGVAPNRFRSGRGERAFKPRSCTTTEKPSGREAGGLFRACGWEALDGDADILHMPVSPAGGGGGVATRAGAIQYVGPGRTGTGWDTTWVRWRGRSRRRLSTSPPRCDRRSTSAVVAVKVPGGQRPRPRLPP